MAIYTPTLLLSQADKRALALLSQLILAADEQTSNNLRSNIIALAPSEAAELLRLLEDFSQSKLFHEGAYFTEQMSTGNGLHLDRLKRIYGNWRRRRGKTNVASSQRWTEFVVRSGFKFSKNAWIWPSDLRRTPVSPMSLEHFYKMERRLAYTAGLHPRVQDLISDYLISIGPQIQEMRNEGSGLEDGTLRKFVEGFFDDLRLHFSGAETQPMSRRRLVSLSTLVMDTGALFATRDWTATGVLSGIGAVIPDALGYEPEE